MAPECFTDNTFSVKSDVWSFGILLWETLSYARKPYGAFNPSEIAHEVKSGRRLERVDGCPEELHSKMSSCWSIAPYARPTFASLQGTMQLLLMEGARSLRARVEASTTKFKDNEDRRWEVPLSHLSQSEYTTVSPQTDGFEAGVRFFLHTNKDSAAKTAAAGESGGGDGGLLHMVMLGVHAEAQSPSAARFESLFTAMRDLKHKNILQFVGVSSTRGYSLLFDLHLTDTLHNIMYNAVADVPAGSGIGARRLVGERTLLSSAAQCIDAALQVACGIEFIHAHRWSHGRLSSHCVHVSETAGSDSETIHCQLQIAGAEMPLGHLEFGSGSVDAAIVLLQPVVRWLAPEAVKRTSLSPASDVFSYGCIVWEILQHLYVSTVATTNVGVGRGAQQKKKVMLPPHAGLFPTAEELLAHIISTKTTPALEAPPRPTSDGVSGDGDGGDEMIDVLHDVFEACQRPAPQDRPSMVAIANILLDLTDGEAGSDRWEIDRDQLTFVENLGSGQYGEVVKMTTRLFSSDGELDFVAAKKLKVGPQGLDSSALAANATTTNDRYVAVPVAEDDVTAAAALQKAEQEFLDEAELMKGLRHPNLVCLLGCCTRQKPYYMVLEFSAGGALEDWLPRNGPKLLLQSTDRGGGDGDRSGGNGSAGDDGAKLTLLLHQVALGFVALGHAMLVHRDLAARNVLIDEYMQVKVADFGLSRDVDEDRNYYRVKSNRAMPLRWMAPESVAELKFSQTTDVYSFGVLVFEVFSFADFPFDDVGEDAAFLDFLCGSGRMPTPVAHAGRATGNQAGTVIEPWKLLLDQLGAIYKGGSGRGNDDGSEVPGVGGSSGAGLGKGSLKQTALAKIKATRTLPAIAARLLKACVIRSPQTRPSFEQLVSMTSTLVMQQQQQVGFAVVTEGTANQQQIESARHLSQSRV